MEGSVAVRLLVEVEDLMVHFLSREATAHAVNGVDLTVMPGEVLCILGESGSGKSVTLRALMRLLPAGRTRIEGRIRIGGQDVLALDGKRRRDLRGGSVSMIFQEPMTALDPVYTVGAQIIETIRRHQGGTKAQARAKALELLDLVKIPSPDRRLDAYPHELSGGLRQRAMIAMALSCGPRLHPYTQGLLSSTVHSQNRDHDIAAIPGSPPDLRRLPPGCSFAPRCAHAMESCRSLIPEPSFPAPGRMVRCLRNSVS